MITPVQVKNKLYDILINLNHIFLGNKYALLIGNDIGTNKSTSTPEILSFLSDHNESDYEQLTFEMELHKPAFDSNIMHFVGQFINDQILICGGIAKMPNKDHATVSKCKAFNFDSYSWEEQHFSLLSARAYAASVILHNGTFLVMGGIDGMDSLKTTEFLTDEPSFVYGLELLDRHADLCAAKINISHVFISGGFQDGEVMPRGIIVLDHLVSQI